MSITETMVQQLGINRLTKSQYDSVPSSEINPNELYLEDPEFNGNKLLMTDVNGEIVETDLSVSDIPPLGPTVITLSNDNTITLADNTCFRGASVTAFTIETPSTDFYPFCSEIDFTSGNTATTITYTGSSILWDANSDDLVDGVFVPVANKKYTLMFWYNGTDYCGTAVGL